MTIDERARIADRRRHRTNTLLIAMAFAQAGLWLPFIIVTAMFDFGMFDVEEHWTSSSFVECLDQSCKVCHHIIIIVHFSDHLDGIDMRQSISIRFYEHKFQTRIR